MIKKIIALSALLFPLGACSVQSSEQDYTDQMIERLRSSFPGAKLAAKLDDPLAIILKGGEWEDGQINLHRIYGYCQNATPEDCETAKREFVEKLSQKPAKLTSTSLRLIVRDQQYLDYLKSMKSDDPQKHELAAYEQIGDDLYALLASDSPDQIACPSSELTCGYGQCLAVLGENGSGKSLLLRSLGLVEEGASGFVEALDRRFDLDGAPPATAIWPELSLVLQSLALWPHLTAERNIRLPWEHREVSKRLDEVQLSELFSRLELDQLLVQHASQLSGGQRQRVALARALAVRPKILLLDEPTSALDARQALAVLDLLLDAKADGAAIIVVTHSLGFASRLADRYLFLHHGGLEETGAWSDLQATRNPELRAYLDLNSVST